MELTQKLANCGAGINVLSRASTSTVAKIERLQARRDSLAGEMAMILALSTKVAQADQKAAHLV